MTADPERVQAADPGFNGWSASSRTSADRAGNRQVAAAAATAKATADPATLTDADLSDMPVELFKQLADEGKLLHLNVGIPRHSGRRR
jgi:hypothetical protein